MKIELTKLKKWLDDQVELTKTHIDYECNLDDIHECIKKLQRLGNQTFGTEPLDNKQN